MQVSNGSLYQRYVPAVRSSGEPNEQAYLFIFRGNMLLIYLEDGRASIPCAKDIEVDITPISKQYLGTLMGEPCYAMEDDADSEYPEGMVFRELLSLYDVLEEDIYALAGRARQILLWDQTHQYCGRCGTRTENLATERAKVCPRCGLTRYTHISPVVITAVLKGDQILLAHPRHPGKMYSVIAGFVEPGETLEEAVQREIMEEVGIKVKNIRYFGSQPWPYPDSLMIGFTAEYDSGEITVDGVEITDAGWFDVHNLPELPPKMSIARELIDWFIENRLAKGGQYKRVSALPRTQRQGKTI
jgi:NAD+ diphosphatase